MTLNEAREIVRDRSETQLRQVEATAVITTSKQSELSDLIRCLRLGGVAAEMAAATLYERTGRPRGGNIAELSTDAAEWSRYLTGQLESAV